MKNKRLLALLLILPLLLSAGCAPRTTAAASSSPPEKSSDVLPSDSPSSGTALKGRVDLLTIPAPSLAGNLLGDPTEQGIGVYLPYDYDGSDKRYPVLYFLPGFEDHYDSYLSDFQIFMDQAMENDMIVVTVNGLNKFNGSFYVNSPVTGNWQDFVTHDVLTYVDSHYRTIPEADARGLAGHSMGGYGVIQIATNVGGLFGSIYAMSPGLFDQNGLADSPMNFKTVQSLIDSYSDLSASDAASKFMSLGGYGWPNDFALAYGAAFAYDTSKAPYIQIPAKNADGAYAHDAVWDRYQDGFGDWEDKLDAHGDNLKALKHFGIEYGTLDEFTWIPKGCDAFDALLTARGIPHQLVTFQGDHQSKIDERIKDALLPFFTQAFADVNAGSAGS